MVRKILLSASFAFILACNSSPRIWPDGEIPFVPIGFDGQTLVQLEKNMLAWEFATNGKIKFINKLIYTNYENKNDIDTLIIFRMHMDDNESQSNTYGYHDNPVVLLEWFETDRGMMHELGHIIGLLHEHQRPDRDLHIKVDLSYVDTKTALKFVYLIPDIYDYKKYPYDVKSIMHYNVMDADGAISEPNDCGGETISPLDGWRVYDMYSDNPSL